jgi:hypothetical protein
MSFTVYGENPDGGAIRNSLGIPQQAPCSRPLISWAMDGRAFTFPMKTTYSIGLIGLISLTS